MSPAKIVRIIGLIVVIVAAFVSFPYAAVAIAILGLAGGYFVPTDHRMLFLIIVVALATAAGSLGEIPAIGTYLTAILSNLSALFNAAAIMVIVTGIYERMTE
jgi:hypothetical protein